jgi:sirohydrochlorin ferrochelatase
VSSLVLVAHGSRDPRAEQATAALTRAVGAARAGCRVAAAYLDFSAPRLPAALAQAQATGGDRPAPPVTVVPLLLTAAYHGRVDVPAEVARAPRGAVRLAEVLGPVGGAGGDAGALDLVVRALRRRLAEAVAAGAPGVVPDGVVLAGAGTRVPEALATVDLVAARLAESLGVPCLPGYASGAGPTVAAAVERLRAGGARRIAAAAYFLAPGRLYDRIAAAATGAGVPVVAEPLGDAPEIVRLVLLRADRAPLAQRDTPGPAGPGCRGSSGLLSAGC